jgi:hypothetical protein
MKYVNHSGGCPGADMAWETAGLEYGVKTIAYSFEGHTQYGANPYIMNNKELAEGWEACKLASQTLKRPLFKIPAYVGKLISRNWFQVKHSEAIFAIGTLVKGSNSLVNGGTGWAVQMSVDRYKLTYLFEQKMNKWMVFSYGPNIFVDYYKTPTLPKNFAGIGTRDINENGLQAILNVYEETFK